MAWNAYLAVTHLKGMQTIAALTLASSKLEASISDVQKDLTDMETGQRGYLLTGDTAYLQPYTDAKAKIEGDFARLRTGLTDRTQRERALESQLESLAKSKQAEMERSISLREQGYRHRAFMLVDTNEGKDYMDEARRTVSALASAERDTFARLDGERIARLNKFLAATAIANCALLALSAGLVWLIRRHVRLLAQESLRSRQELVKRDLQLEKLTSALSGQARSSITAMNTNSRLLLENYGGFLPRQGHEYAEQMREAATQMEQLRRDLVGNPVSEGVGAGKAA